MPSNVIGLELMDGSVWYCPRSVLTSATGSYFAARFGDDAKIPAGAEWIDEKGRNVYFIARDGELFGKYVLPYLVKNRPGRLPSFSADPELWRELREEAEFYGLVGLSNMLLTTKTFTPEKDGDKGVLYWLGTNKGTKEYQNPFSIGAVDVTGWVDMTREECAAIGDPFIAKGDDNDDIKSLASLPSSRQVLVQYHPPVKGLSLHARDTCYLLWCHHSYEYLYPVVVDLKSIKLQVTAYSFRWDINCGGVTDWNLEGSVDGSNWDVLHAARDQKVFRDPSSEEISLLTNFRGQDTPQKREFEAFLLAHVERHHRHYFRIENENTTYYRYIRFTSCKVSSSCLHGVGLELYGNVQEE